MYQEKKTPPCSVLNAFLCLQGKQDRAGLEGLKCQTAEEGITSGSATAGAAVSAKRLLDWTVARWGKAEKLISPVLLICFFSSCFETDGKVV